MTTEFRREGRPALWTNNKPLSMSGSLDGAPAQFQAVLPDLLFAAPWQTYRLPVGPAERARPFELTISVNLPRNADVVFAGHILPGFQDSSDHRRPTGRATAERLSGAPVGANPAGIRWTDTK